MNRREFLGSMSAIAAAGVALRAQTRRLDRLGVQLYTARTEMAKDVEATLARLAAIGIREVEFAGYFDRPPQAIRAMLDRHGLTAPAAHVDYASISERLPALIESSRVIGHRYLVLPNLDEKRRAEPDIWPRVADMLNRAGETARAAGITIGYHNHQFEFAPVNGRLPYDILLERCDPSLVVFELDLCWITVAGQDPLAYFNKFPGRFPMVHVKDVRRLPPPGSAATIPDVLPDLTDVGAGVIDWRRLFAASDQAGIRHYFIEHDRPLAPFDSVEASYKYLRALTF